MKLLYVPKYNHSLDVAFTERGTANPARYGLTRGQIEELKQAGQWEKFFCLWKSARLKFLAKNNKLCVICSKDDKKAIVVLGQRICRECCASIHSRMHGT